MLVVDLLHEFELGVWKAVFIHLIRILVSVGEGVVQEFNLRYAYCHDTDLYISETHSDSSP